MINERGNTSLRDDSVNSNTIRTYVSSRVSSRFTTTSHAHRRIHHDRTIEWRTKKLPMYIVHAIPLMNSARFKIGDIIDNRTMQWNFVREKFNSDKIINFLIRIRDKWRRHAFHQSIERRDGQQIAQNYYFYFRKLLRPFLVVIFLIDLVALRKY
jgi:hypothetical protein